MLSKTIFREKETFLYVAESATYATGNQAMFRASDFVGATAVNGVENKTTFRFHKQDGTIMNTNTELGNGGYDFFTLTHTDNAHVEVMKAVADALSNTRGGIIVVCDPANTMSLGITQLNLPNIASTGTSVSVSAVSITTVDA